MFGYNMSLRLARDIGGLVTRNRMDWEDGLVDKMPVTLVWGQEF